MFAFTELKPEGITLAADQKILRASDYQEYLSAAMLVDAAKEQAKSIEDEASAVYEEQKKLGWQAGMEAVRAEQAALIHETQLKCQQYYKVVEEQLTDVVLQSVRRILSDYDDVALTLQVVREALSLVSNQKQVTLRVAPEQVAEVREQIASVHKDFPEISYIEVSADARLDAGGGILETEVGVIDASIDGQMSALTQALKESFQTEQEGEASTHLSDTP